MRILLTNDDGYDAPGIRALHDALIDESGEFGSPLGEIFTVAPTTVQSATSHGITFHKPLMTELRTDQESMRGVAVDGRPADCVKLALANLWREHSGFMDPPDLVISGMNAGANVGINVIYSGTVAAALEAAFLGVPAVAVSLHLGAGEACFDRAAAHARRAIEHVLSLRDKQGAAPALQNHSCMNINVPRCESEDCPMPTMRMCSMNTHGHNDRFEKRASPGGGIYYWAATGGLDFRDADAESDVARLLDREITITPLHHDLTDTSKLAFWKSIGSTNEGLVGAVESTS
ncbi:MAG: 5'/3'-nucleotidase SurE [Planctomycetota bacterium]|jgi:5'-nucleotidase